MPVMVAETDAVRTQRVADRDGQRRSKTVVRPVLSNVRTL
jgi:hypothetical protein